MSGQGNVRVVGKCLNGWLRGEVCANVSGEVCANVSGEI